MWFVSRRVGDCNHLQRVESLVDEIFTGRQVKDTKHWIEIYIIHRQRRTTTIKNNWIISPSNHSTNIFISESTETTTSIAAAIKTGFWSAQTVHQNKAPTDLGARYSNNIFQDTHKMALLNSRIEWKRNEVRVRAPCKTYVLKSSKKHSIQPSVMSSIGIYRGFSWQLSMSIMKVFLWQAWNNRAPRM